MTPAEQSTMATREYKDQLQAIQDHCADAAYWTTHLSLTQFNLHFTPRGRPDPIINTIQDCQYRCFNTWHILPDTH